MAISTDSIIHYTDTFKKLTSILEEGFRIKYCSEILYMGTRKSSLAHPIISFCDIPLSESFRHFGLYGYYGVGLSKQWASEKQINPVLYIEKNSYIGKAIRDAFGKHPLIKGEHDNVFSEMLIMTKCYAKNYVGPLKRGNIDTKEYKFYDEREWRFIPQKIDIKNHSRSLPLSKYEVNKKEYNDNLSDYRLKFEVMDISYIIVKETKEIPDMLEFLRNKFHKQLRGDEMDILLSKVCSTEQIIKDY